MPHAPIRTRQSRLAHRVGARQSTAGLAEDLAALGAAVATLQAELKPLPERLAGLAKSGDAQRKRLDAVAAAQERSQVLMGRLEERLNSRPGLRLRQLATRVRALLPRRDLPTPPPAPPPAALPIDWVLSGGRLAPGTRSVLIALFGLEPAARELVVERLTASAALAEPPLLPVFVTETSDFTPMRRARAAFEHLPLQAGERSDAPRRDWQLYLVRRFAGMCAKWQPVQVVAFGTAASRQLAVWRTSPHLPAQVKDLLAVTAEPPLALR